MKEKKKIIFCGIIIVAVIAIAVLGLLLIQTNNKLNKVNNDFSKTQKELTNSKNELAEKEKEIKQIKGQNSASIDKYKKSLSKKNKRIKKLENQIKKYKQKEAQEKELAKKVATVGVYDNGGRTLTVTSASSSSISFDFLEMHGQRMVEMYGVDVSLSDGKGYFDFEDEFIWAKGSIEVIDSKTIKFSIYDSGVQEEFGEFFGVGTDTLYLK